MTEKIWVLSGGMTGSKSVSDMLDKWCSLDAELYRMKRPVRILVSLVFGLTGAWR